MVISCRLLPLILTIVLASTKLYGQIFADVEVSGGVNGTFRIELEYQKTPATVANFVGLATGQRGWIDYLTGAIRYDGYYNGVTFHRVIAGFMNQTGSRKGDGTDGPGYTFKDEFDPSLVHDAAYVVSMANSGKHTNGSQFFITAGPQTHLNGKHAVFGHVISGQAVVDQINATPTNASDRPLTPIVIQSIVVSGPSLAGFALAPLSLPKVLDAHPILTKSGSTYTLGYDARTYSNYTGFRGTDLAAWTRFRSLYFAGLAPSGSDDVTSLATGSRHFFRMARIDYEIPANKFVPATIGGRSFVFPNGFIFPVEITINAAGTGGTWNFPGSGSGTLHTVTYTLGPYTPTLYLRLNSTPNYNFDIEFLYTLDYASANAGTYSALTNVDGYTNIAGSFTTTP